MPPKNGSKAGDAGDQTDQVTLYPVRLVKPARINGLKYEAGEVVSVDETIGEQLARANAIEPPDIADLNKPTEDQE